MSTASPKTPRLFFPQSQLQWRKKQQKIQSALQKLFAYAQDERDAECRKNTLKCTLVFLFAVFLHYFVLWQLLRQISSSKRRPILAARVAFYGWSKVQEMIKYAYILFISLHSFCISLDYSYNKMSSEEENVRVKTKDEAANEKTQKVSKWL